MTNNLHSEPKYYANLPIRICIRFAVLVLIVLVTGSNAWSQETKDSTLHEFKIEGKTNISNDAKVNVFAPGLKVTTIDSATLQQYQMQSMASLLAQQVPVFVKSYGFNQLATLNFRGSSAAQSAVLWNGIPIQNAAMGIADVSMIPVMLMSRANVVYGSSSALWGSGNVGGALLLENEAAVFGSAKTTLAASAGTGSFGQYMASFKSSILRKKFYFSTSFFGQSATNDFRYTTQSGAHHSLQNDHLISGSLMLHAAVLDTPSILLNAYLWLQQYDREIPPALFETASLKKQKDIGVRFLTDWQKPLGKGTYYGKLAIIYDKINYSDDDVHLNTESKTRSVFIEMGWRKQFRNLGQLMVFAPCQFSWMSNGAENEDTAQQQRAALVAAWEMKALHQKLNISASVRGEIIDNDQILLPGINASYRLTRWLSLRANAQRTYRAPSLIELYSFPGGNLNLKPEQGWSEDAGYTVNAKIGHLAVFHDLAVFNRDIHDWIYWLGGTIWTPHNISEVNSRGIETENKLTYTLGKWKIHAGLNTSYVLATTTSSYIYNDGSIDKQIPYTPRYNGQLNIGFGWKGISLNYNHTYTGYRFTTTDESSWMLPYSTGNVQLMYNKPIRNHSCQIIASCNNIWNQQYQLVDQRPMPCINWLVGIRVE
jgi:vitamin B12 transporter